MRGCRVRDIVNINILSKGVPVNFVSFHGLNAEKEHIAIVAGDLGESPLVRIHSECLTGDVFGSQRCDCGAQLHEALEIITSDGGVLLYLRQEGRGIGLYEKLSAYRLQDKGMDTFEANRHLNHPEDARNFNDAVKMLKALDIKSCRLITNNPDKVSELRASDISVEEVIPTGVFMTDYNRDYLMAKVIKKNHFMNINESL